LNPQGCLRRESQSHADIAIMLAMANANSKASKKVPRFARCVHRKRRFPDPFFLLMPAPT
jgi:hypothetical protein